MKNKLEVPKIPVLDKYRLATSFTKAKPGSDHDYLCKIKSLEMTGSTFFIYDEDKFINEICSNNTNSIIKIVVSNITHHDNDCDDHCASLTYYARNGVLHNLNGPAVISKYINNKTNEETPSCKEYYIDGNHVCSDDSNNYKQIFKEEVIRYFDSMTSIKNTVKKPIVKKPTAKKQSVKKTAAKKPATKKAPIVNKSKTPILDSLCSNYTFNPSVEKGCDIECNIENFRIAKYNESDYALSNLNKEISSIHPGKNIKVIYEGLIGDIETRRVSIVEHICDGEYHNAYGPAIYSINKNGDRFDGYYYDHGKEIGYCDRDEFPINGITSIIEDHGYAVTYTPAPENNGISYDYDILCEFSGLDMNELGEDYKEEDLNREICKELPNKRIKVVYKNIINDDDERTEVVDYLYNSKLHRDDGPARYSVYSYGNKLNGTYYTHGDFVAHCDNNKYPIEGRLVEKKIEDKKVVKPTTVKSHSGPGYVQYTVDTNDIKYIEKEIKRINNLKSSKDILVHIKTKNITYSFFNGRLHDDKEAAIEIRDNSGNLVSEEYYLDGKKAYFYNYKINKEPKKIKTKMNKKEENLDYYEEENSDYIIRYKKGTKIIHCSTGPAVEYKNRNRKEWFVDGRLHRLDGPAIIEKYKDEPTTKLYYINGYSLNETNFYIKLRSMGLATIGSDEEMQNKQVVKTTSGSETLNTVSEEKTTSPNIATEKAQEDNKKPMANKEFKLFDADRWLAESKKAGIRVTANQITDFVSGALVNFIAKQFGDTPEIRLYAETVIKTKAGKALVSTVAGNVIPMIEQLNGNETATILAEEFRIQAMETIGNQLMSFVMAELVPGIAGIVSAIPAQIAPTSIQKEASGVKQLRVEHPEQVTEEESNVVPIAVKNAL